MRLLFSKNTNNRDIFEPCSRRRFNDIFHEGLLKITRSYTKHHITENQRTIKPPAYQYKYIRFTLFKIVNFLPRFAAPINEQKTPRQLDDHRVPSLAVPLTDRAHHLPFDMYLRYNPVRPNRWSSAIHVPCNISYNKIPRSHISSFVPSRPSPLNSVGTNCGSNQRMLVRPYS